MQPQMKRVRDSNATVLLSDQKLLSKLAPQVGEAISKVPGLVEIKNGIIPAPQIMR